MKKLMENKLQGGKKNIRAVLIDRTHLQHESRLVENVNKDFTEYHKKIFDDILTLATNHYSVVRIRGQDLLSRCFRYFSYSFKVLLPRLLELLQSNEDISHEQFKGALFVLLGKGGKSFLTKHCWTTFNSVCPAILRASHSEKPSIIKVLGMLFDSVLHHMDTFTIRLEIHESTVSTALQLWNSKVFIHFFKHCISSTIEKKICQLYIIVTMKH